MEEKYLYRVLPFLKDVEKKRRKEIENYFISAPVWLMDSFNVIHLDKGEIFVKENAPADTIYIVGSGKIKATDFRVFGLIYDFMEFEGVYGMGGMEVVMDEEVYRTTLSTVTPCTMITIPRAKFDKWLRTDIKALKQEAKAIGQYLLEQGRKERTFLFLQGSDRLCMLLVQKYRQLSKDGVLVLSITRQDLSEKTGLCVKTINRAVKKLTEEGMISRQGNKIVMNREQYKKMDAMISGIVEQ